VRSNDLLTPRGQRWHGVDGPILLVRFGKHMGKVVELDCARNESAKNHVTPRGKGRR
jgi:hypothetical protein